MALYLYASESPMFRWDNEYTWVGLYGWLFPLVKRWVYTSNVSYRQCHANDIKASSYSVTDSFQGGNHL